MVFSFARGTLKGFKSEREGKYKEQAHKRICTKVHEGQITPRISYTFCENPIVLSENPRNPFVQKSRTLFAIVICPLLQ